MALLPKDPKPTKPDEASPDLSVPRKPSLAPAVLISLALSKKQLAYTALSSCFGLSWPSPLSLPSWRLFSTCVLRFSER
jgi:hypothetical protein